jgi:hypothetical protein
MLRAVCMCVGRAKDQGREGGGPCIYAICTPHLKHTQSRAVVIANANDLRPLAWGNPTQPPQWGGTPGVPVETAVLAASPAKTTGLCAAPWMLDAMSYRLLVVLPTTVARGSASAACCVAP